MQPDDGVRVLRGDLLDLDAALGREHQQVLLGGPVEGEAGVVLLVDVRGPLDPHSFDAVALDVHAEDVPGVQADLVGVVGELDPARLAAAADLDLRLHDDRVAGRLGLRDRLVDGLGDAAGADRDPEAGEVLLALVFEQIHRSSFVVGVGGRGRAAPYAVAVGAMQRLARMGRWLRRRSPASPRPGAPAGPTAAAFAVGAGRRSGARRRDRPGA